jgi:hypothetical protein
MHILRSMFTRVLLVVLFSLPLFGINLSPERPVTPAVAAIADNDGSLPYVATDGLGFLVVWRDFRASPDGSTVRFSRVSADGVLSHPTGKTLPGLGGGPAAVFWSGTDYVVFSSGSDAVARISRDGTEIQSPIRIDGFHSSGLDRYASNGQTFLVLTNEGDPSDNTRVAVAYIIGADLKLVKRIELPGSEPGFFDGAQILGGSEYLIAYTTLTGPVSVRLTSDGQLAAPPEKLVNVPSGAMTLGSNLLAVYSPDQRANVVVTRLDGAGRVAGQPVILDAGYSTGITLAGDGWLVPVWSLSRPEASVFRVPFAEGETLKVLSTRDLSAGFDAATAANRIMLVADGPRGVMFQFADRSGRAFDDPQTITWRVPSQELPSIASDGERYLVAWREELTAIRAMLFDRGGRRLLADALRLDRSVTLKGPPKITFDGDTFLCVWAEAEETSVRTVLTPLKRIVALRVGADGSFPDDDPLVISRSTEFDAYALNSAGNGSSLLLWSDGHFLEAALIRGNAAAAPFTIVASEAVGSVDIATDGAEYLAVWTESEQVSGALIGADGRPGSVVQLAESGTHPVAAWGPRGYFVAWSRNNLLRGRLLHDATDQLLAFPASGFDPFVPQQNDLVFDGNHLVLAFAYLGDLGSCPPILCQPPSIPDVHVRYIAADGTPLGEEAGIRVSRTPGRNDDSVALVANDGVTAIVYSRVVAEAEIGVRRVFLRFLERAETRRRPARR